MRSLRSGEYPRGEGGFSAGSHGCRLYSTVGVHPTRCSEFLEGNPEEMMKELIAIGKEGKAEKKIVAVGEFGLDYDRLHFCDKEVG